MLGAAKSSKDMDMEVGSQKQGDESTRKQPEKKETSKECPGGCIAIAFYGGGRNQLCQMLLDGSTALT